MSKDPIPGSTAHAIHLTGYQMGRDDEQARIIKLLESDEGQKIMCLECSDELIALIKGE